MQIIVRARQSHLLNKYISELASSAAPFSSRVLQEVSTAWTAYFTKTLSASLASPVADSSFESAAAAWRTLQERAASDPAWFEAEKVKNEKFSMYMSSAQSGYAALVEAQDKEQKATGSVEDAKALIEANRDAMGLWLDKQVRRDVPGGFSASPIRMSS